MAKKPIKKVPGAETRLKAELVEIDKAKQLTKRGIVAFARNNPKSEIWRRFAIRGLWDDKVAAEEGRLNFAGYLIRNVFVERPSFPTEKKRMFVHRPSAKTYEQASYTVRSRSRREEYREELARRTKGELHLHLDFLYEDEMAALENLISLLLRTEGEIEAA